MHSPHCHGCPRPHPTSWILLNTPSLLPGHADWALGPRAGARAGQHVRGRAPKRRPGTRAGGPQAQAGLGLRARKGRASRPGGRRCPPALEAGSPRPVLAPAHDCPMDRCPPWRCRPWPSAGGEEPLGPLRFRAEAGVGSRALPATAHSPRPTAAPALCSPPAWVPAWCSPTTPPSFSPSVRSLNPGLVPTGPAPQPSCRRWSLSALSLSTQKEARPSGVHCL